MPENIIKPTGATKASKNDAGGGVLRSEPVIAIVKNNVDPIRQGRLQVFIEDLNGPDPDDSKSWVTVSYMSPFYGKTYGSSGSSGYGSFGANPVSYGEWHSPPDIGTRVICIFVNGDPNYGYYIGCIPEPELLTMVPAIGAVDSKVTMNAGEATSLAGATQLPVTNINTDNKGESKSNNFLDSPKPVHSYVASTLAQQGLLRDTVRGPITSSAQRETPSRVGWGVSTPGRPIYEGGLTDDKVVDSLDGSQAAKTKVVSRRAGHTFVMDDGDITGKDQLVRLRTALGHQILMSDDGQCLFIIHANGQSWIELGKEGTIDMFSTNSVNIRTQGDLNLHADNNVNIHANKNLNLNAKENININSDKDTAIRTGTNFKHEVVENFTTKVGASMSMSSANEGSYASSGTMYINGSIVNLNSGQPSLTPLEVKPIPLIAQTDTLFDSEKGYAPAPGKLQTIVSRAPAHQPWAMANKGVDIKVQANADANLPEQPSETLTDTNSVVPSLPDNPATLATTATVPNVGEASAMLGSGTTAALVSATAVSAGSISGTAITDGIAKIGALGQTPQQLVSGGTLKPGSEKLINGLVQQGASVTGAMTKNMFTGSVSNDLPGFISDTTAQVKSQVVNFSKAQEQLTGAGILTGNEAPSAAAGVILSASQNGLQQTADFIKTAASAGGQIPGASQLGSMANSVAQSISSGNFAGSLATTVSGALGGIAASLGSAMDSAKGAVASAFGSIVGAYKKFTPGIPQDLKAIASKASEPKSPISDPAAKTASMALNLAASKTGLQGIPGGEKVIASVINNAPGAINAVPGTDALKSVIGNTSTGLVNNISGAAAEISSQAGSLISGGGISGGLTPQLGGLLKNNPLSSGVSSLLPPDLAAQLNSAISALSSTGPTEIKLPTVAENTFDRSGSTKMVGSIISNPKIPAPSYSSDDYIQYEQEKLLEFKTKLKTQQKEFDVQFEVAKSAKEEWLNAQNNYPEGDPRIAQSKQKFDTEVAKLEQITLKLKT